MHQAGMVLPDRDGLHWLRCTVCGREWAEKDSGALAQGSRTCGPTVREQVRDQMAAQGLTRLQSVVKSGETTSPPVAGKEDDHASSIQ